MSVRPAATTAHESAGAHLTGAVPTAAPPERADLVRARIAAGSFASVDRIWVVDDGRLVGVVAIDVLLRANPEASVGSLATIAPSPVDVGVDQELVALRALAEELDAVPITRQGRFVGVVTARALLRVLHREHGEDLHRLVGIAPERPPFPSADDEPAARNALHRLPWLLVGLGGSLVASAILGSYEDLLRRDLAVAFFIPAIVYIADAVGTQTEAIVVRRLALRSTTPFPVVLRELGTGTILGVVLGAVAAPVVALVWGDPTLGIAVGVSVLVATSLATIIGMSLPWILSRGRADPALGSGPLATVIQDGLSIAVYLAVVRAMLG